MVIASTIHLLRVCLLATLLIRTVAYKKLVRFPPQDSPVDVCVHMCSDCTHLIKLFLVSIPKGRWTKCLKNNWPCNNWGHLGDISRPGVQKCSRQPGANSRHDGATDRACRLPTLYKEEMANRNTVLTVRNLNGTSSRGSNWAFERASKTTVKSQVGILGHSGGLSLLIPWRNYVTSRFLHKDWSPTGEWWAAIVALYTLSVLEDNPEANLSCRNSNTDPIGHSTVSSWRLWQQDVKSCYLAAFDFLVEGALDCRMVSTTSVERPDYIYIYAFSRRFYPKRLTVHSDYTFFVSMYMCSLGIEPTTFALLMQCSNHWATETQEHAMRCAPSGTTPTASTNLGGNMKDGAPCLREEIPA